MNDHADTFLDAWLEPLLPMLARADVTDLFINRPGEVWIETLGGRLERHVVDDLDEPRLWRIARQVASLGHQAISRAYPLLAASLPGGARVQVVAPPATRGSLAIAIRKHVVADQALANYLADGAFSATRFSRGWSSARPVDLPASNAPEDIAAYLGEAVRRRRNIIVSGGTSTGKTTFLNALIREIPAQERLILIEDTAELIMRHDNAVGLVAVKGEQGEARVNTDDLLQASLRMRPDRIILGELRGIEAYTFLRAVNTGHPGSMTTIHADSPQGAIEQLALIILQSGVQLRREDIVAYVLNVVDIVVQLERRDGVRRIAQVTSTRLETEGQG